MNYQEQVPPPGVQPTQFVSAEDVRAEQARVEADLRLREVAALETIARTLSEIARRSAAGL